MSLSLVACGVGSEETELQAPVEATEEAAAENPGPEAMGACEPGPSSNWCINVAGKACSTTTNRRCFDPGYCEWYFCRCIGGIWECI